MTEPLPEPLTPADCDLRSFVYMPVDIIRLFSSEFHAKANDAEWRAGFTLWLKSYHQVPAGSVPDDDVILARMAELGRDVDGWKALRPMALHGWVKCSDGRLYHPVVAEKANEAWQSKIRKRAGAEHTNSVRGKRKATATDTATHSVTPSVTPSATDSAADSATVSGRNERRGEETKGDEQQRARTDLEKRTDLILLAFDQALRDTFGTSGHTRTPGGAGMDIVHATRWAEMGLDPQALYQFFAERQQARQRDGKPAINSLAFLRDAVPERFPTFQARAPGGDGQPTVRFLSPADEIAARHRWWTSLPEPRPRRTACGFWADPDDGHRLKLTQPSSGVRPEIPAEFLTAPAKTG